MKDYDLVVIGSGPAGEKGAAQVAYFGKKVALVEKEPHFGGAAANTGTLPSKTLRETSIMLSGFRARGLYGVDLSLRREATVRDFLFREEQVVTAERERVTLNVERHGIDVFRGMGSFVDDHTVRVNLEEGGEELLRGEVILVATGSYPHRPEIYEFDHPLVYDSDEILQIHIMPRSLAIVGAGVIGSEYACLFSALDVEAHLIDGREELMGFLDDEISNSLKARMQKMGIEMIMPDSVESCAATDTDVTLKLTSGRELVVDAVLVASGRSGNTTNLNVDAAGLEMGRRGQLTVNDNYQTNVPHIYAAGDVIGFPALASTSMEQARLAMVHAFGLEYKKEVAPILPYGIYTIPEVSMAGESEESAKEKGIDYVIGKASYTNNARGMIIGDFDGFLKLLYRADDMKLIGVHVIGEIASEVVHIGLMAMMTDSSSELFIRTCFNYPTLGELYKYATYDAMGNLAKRKGEDGDG
ncbi:MAG: Si-specific NAD(P)(+) transhydrogenase [Planctomycetota bacterium]|nr:Si-specific NAD(P)(+) transhydrogenase [Planctomycetota bacterium]